MRGMFGFTLQQHLLAGAAIVAVASASPAMAQTRQFNVPAQSASRGIPAFARQAGVQIIASGNVVGNRRINAVQGTYSVQEGLRILLNGTGLAASGGAGGIITIRGAGSSGEIEAGSAAAGTEGLLRENSVVVVGSRLETGSPVDRAMPVRVITREQIDRSGAGTIAEVFRYVPEVSVNNVGDTNIGATPGSGDGNSIDATTVQLRGLPAGTTLILINGHRSGESSAFQNSGQFDLSTIPLALVERIEILPAGASAIYGGDALAGVVNIVLRRDASGFELRGRQMITDGYDTTEASLLWGHSWSNAQITIGANYRRASKLTSFERGLTANEDYTRFGGDDYRSSFSAYPANVYSLAGCPAAPDLCFTPVSQRGNLPGLNSPFATVPTGQNGQNLTPAAFVATAGRTNVSSSESSLFSPSTNYGVNVAGSVNVTHNVELFAEFTYSRREVPAVVVPLAMIFGQYGFASARVSANNPYNPFGVDVGIDLRIADTGVIQDFSQDYWRGLVGARGNLGRWHWEITASQSRDHADIVLPMFNSDAVAAALQSSNPATAINPFAGDGTAPWSDQLLQSLLLPDQNIRLVSKLADVVATVRGPLFTLPAGDVLVAAGGEYQRSTLVSDGSLATTGSGDTSWAQFAEIRVPVLRGGDDGRERLALTGAWRRETAGRYAGAANTATGGIEFRPTRSLLFRGTYSTSFKPLATLRTIQVPSGFGSFAGDPRFGNQQFPVQYISGGGVPDGLKPETGASWTLGAVFAPSSRFRASATYWNNRLRNRFTTPSPDFLLANEDIFQDRIVRDPVTGFLVSLDIRSINIARTDLSGMDFAVGGRWSTGIGDFIPSLGATWTLRYREQTLPILPVQNNLGIFRDTGWAPRWKIVPQLGWEVRDRFFAQLSARYVSSYRDPTPLSNGPNAGQEITLGNLWYFDFNINLEVGKMLAPHSAFLAGLRLNLGVNNIFDRGPDFCNSCGSGGYDASQYDILGRSFYAALRMSF